MAELDLKLEGSRNTYSDLQPIKQQLSVDWQRITNDTGPGVSEFFARLIGDTATFVDLLR